MNPVDVESSIYINSNKGNNNNKKILDLKLLIMDTCY